MSDSGRRARPLGLACLRRKHPRGSSPRQHAKRRCSRAEGAKGCPNATRARGVSHHRLAAGGNPERDAEQPLTAKRAASAHASAQADAPHDKQTCRCTCGASAGRQRAVHTTPLESARQRVTALCAQGGKQLRRRQPYDEGTQHTQLRRRWLRTRWRAQQAQRSAPPKPSIWHVCGAVCARSPGRCTPCIQLVACLLHLQKCPGSAVCARAAAWTCQRLRPCAHTRVARCCVASERALHAQDVATR
jgi:hypothetical protein